MTTCPPYPVLGPPTLASAPRTENSATDNQGEICVNTGTRPIPPPHPRVVTRSSSLADSFQGPTGSLCCTEDNTTIDIGASLALHVRRWRASFVARDRFSTRPTLLRLPLAKRRTVCKKTNVGRAGPRRGMDRRITLGAGRRNPMCSTSACSVYWSARARASGNHAISGCKPRSEFPRLTWANATDNRGFPDGCCPAVRSLETDRLVRVDATSLQSIRKQRMCRPGRLSGGRESVWFTNSCGDRDTGHHPS
jgi:hypothetical protein